MKKLNTKLIAMRATISYAMSNKKAAALWEYLVLIAVVIIIAGVFVAVLGDENGGLINDIWTTITDKIKNLFNSGF